MNRFSVCIMCLLMVSMAVLTGCAAGQSPFVNTQTTEQYVQGPDGRVTKVTTVHRQDRSGDMVGNLLGTAANAGMNALNTGFATNWGKGYPRNRQMLHNLTYPTGMFNSNWGTNSWGTGYYGGSPSFVPRGGILVH